MCGFDQQKLQNCLKGSIFGVQKGVQSVTLLKRKHFGDPKRGPKCDIWTKCVVLKQNKGPKGLWRDLELVDLLHFFRADAYDTQTGARTDVHQSFEALLCKSSFGATVI